MENRFGTFGDNDSAKGSLFNERISDIGNEFIEEYNALEASAEYHITSTLNPHSTTKSQVGLGSVDNTADADKPISTVQKTAILNQNRISSMGGMS